MTDYAIVFSSLTGNTAQPLLDNFDRALTHPDEEDLALLEETVRKVWTEYNE